jgi:hypothetical protein
MTFEQAAEGAVRVLNPLGFAVFYRLSFLKGPPTTAQYLTLTAMPALLVASALWRFSAPLAAVVLVMGAWLLIALLLRHALQCISVLVVVVCALTAAIELLGLLTLPEEGLR